MGLEDDDKNKVLGFFVGGDLYLDLDCINAGISIDLDLWEPFYLNGRIEVDEIGRAD